MRGIFLKTLFILAFIVTMLFGGFNVFAADKTLEDNNLFESIVDLSVLSDINQSNANSMDDLEIVAEQAILEGDTKQMLLEGCEVHEFLNKVEWSSSNPNVISCTKNGEIKGLRKGSAVITVKNKSGGKSDSITVYCVKKLDGQEKTRLLTIAFWTNKTPVFFGFQKLMFNDIFLSRKVTILGYYDNYFYVRFEDSGNTYDTFIWSIFLPSNVASDEIFRQLSVYEIVVNSGETSAERLTTKYTGTVKWRVSDNSVIDFDSETGKIKAKKPGTAIITATVGTTTKSCIVFSVSSWYEPEVSVSTKSVTVKSIPATTGKTVATLSKGTSMTADGDLENGWNWIHITSGDVSGFIQLSDFPGIDYLMSEYHYYDEGFEVRYDSPISKILDYSYVLNDVMMANFNLKICPHVEQYTSLADRCKKTTYGSVYTNNLFASCPETGVHSSNSCLDYIEMRKTMLKDKGSGSEFVGRCLWTGHILDPHLTSVTNEPLKSIVFTCRNVTSYSSSSNRYNNISDDEIWEQRITEIVHETAHLLGAEDGYCFGIPEGEGRCENSYCYSCNEEPVPNCIMAKQVVPDAVTDVFCDECKENIRNYLIDNH